MIMRTTLKIPLNYTFKQTFKHIVATYIKNQFVAVVPSSPTSMQALVDLSIDSYTYSLPLFITFVPPTHIHTQLLSYTPLHWTCAEQETKGLAKVATVLLQNGAPRTHQNKHGETATDLARRFGNMKMLDLLKRWEEKEAEAKLKQKQTANREAELKLQAMRKSEADADRRMKERFKQEAIQADAKRKAASNVVLAERAKKEREASMTHSDDSRDDPPHLLWLFFLGGGGA